MLLLLACDRSGWGGGEGTLTSSYIFTHRSHERSGRTIIIMYKLLSTTFSHRHAQYHHTTLSGIRVHQPHRTSSFIARANVGGKQL